MPVLSVTPLSGDGSVFYDNAGTWAGVRNGSAGSGGADHTSNPTRFYAAKIAATFYCGRLFLPFDTSALTTDATIVSAVLKFTVEEVLSANATAHLVQTNAASNTALATSDFNSVTYTTGGNVLVSSTGQKIITLNGTALTWISKTGVTKLGIVEDHDYTNTEPAVDNRIDVYMGEDATAGNRPTLEITYTTPFDGRVGDFKFL